MTRRTPTDDLLRFARQSLLRGNLGPAPPKTPCSSCSTPIIPINSDKCVPCRNAGKHAGNSNACTPDSFVTDCPVCKRDTLHLGTGWCVECKASKGHGEFSLFCLDCDLREATPMAVKDDRGGLVDMMKVNKLWCVRCKGLVDSYERKGPWDLKPEQK